MSTTYEVPSWETGLEELAPNVYAYIQAKGSWFWSNAGLIVGNEYAIVVDSLATVGLTQTLIDEIRKVTWRPVCYLVNTHHHGDHIWGNHLFTGANIICHRCCREEAIRTGITDPSMLAMVFPEFDFHGIQVTPLHITFEKQLTIHLDDREARKRFDRGMSIDEAARDIDLGRFKRWVNWERIIANLERLQREFRGEEPTSKIDAAALIERMNELVASSLQAPPFTKLDFGAEIDTIWGG